MHGVGYGDIVVSGSFVGTNLLKTGIFSAECTKLLLQALRA